MTAGMLRSSYFLVVWPNGTDIEPEELYESDDLEAKRGMVCSDDRG